MPRYAALWRALADMHIRYSPPQVFQKVPRLTTAEYVAASYVHWEVRTALQAMRFTQQLCAMPFYVAQVASTPAEIHKRYSPPQLLRMVPRLTTAEYVAAT
jgi:hypothetical protein